MAYAWWDPCDTVPAATWPASTPPLRHSANPRPHKPPDQLIDFSKIGKFVTGQSVGQIYAALSRPVSW